MVLYLVSTLSCWDCYMKLLSKFSSHERKAEKTGKTSYANLKLALTLVVLEFEELLDSLKHY